MGFFPTFADVRANGIIDFGNKALKWGGESIQEARNAEGRAVAQGAGKLVNELTKNEQTRAELLRRIDKRKDNRYIGNGLIQPCPNNKSSHPNPNDGGFMGGDCCDGKKCKENRTSEQEPDMGKKPSCYTGHPTKSFPKVYYQNGMNNTEEVVCETMGQIADSQCVEVVGIYNATYNDAVRIRSADADYSNVKRKAIETSIAEGKSGTMKGAVSGMSGGLIGMAVGSATGAIGGATKGVMIGGAREAALEKAASSGMVQDVLDCLDNLNGAGTEASKDTQADLWYEKLSKGEPVQIYSHSQGGLITREALVSTQDRLYSQRFSELRRSGETRNDASARAQQFAAERMKLVTVNSFGTLERDLPSGPTYNRMTNQSDPVPEVIRVAQKNYGRPIESDPPGSPPVHVFNNNPSVLDPFAAHGMPCYLAELERDQIRSGQRKEGKSCC